MIRRANIADLPKLAPLACEFYAASAFLRQFDIERFQSLWKGLLELGTGVIFVLEVNGGIAGVIGGVVHPEAYSGDLIAQEFFWFVKDGNRGQGVRLYHQFENWAREQGCQEIRMGHLSDLMPEKVAHFYQRLGYRKIETAYGKRLDETPMRKAG